MILRKLLAALLLCLGAGHAQAASSPPFNYSTPSYFADQMSLQAQAPRHARMTFSVGEALPAFRNPGYSTLSTYVVFVPVETTAYAIRIGLADPYTTQMQIVSASVWPTDTYSGPNVNPTQWWSSGTQTAGIPTANTVFQTCTTTLNSTSVSCSNTALLPSGATMYVLGQNVSPNTITATVADSTHVTLSSNATASGTVSLQFSNLASECRVYFDNQGADVDTINSSGTNRSLTVPGNPSSPNNNAQQFTLTWSDYVPCTTVARADGGNQQLIAVYITMGPSTTAFGSPGLPFSSYNTNVAPLLGNRFIYTGLAWAGNSDWADNPAGTGYKGFVISPLLTVSYISATRGWTVVQTGDSISQAPPDDSFSSPVYRGCKVLSTPQAPCEWVGFAWGGTASSVYDEVLRNNLLAIQPSAIVMQPISRNDPGSVSLGTLQTLLARAESYTQKIDARLGFYGAFPLTTTLDGNTSGQAAVAAMRSTLATISKTCQPNAGGQTCPMVPVLDPVPILSRAVLGGNAWDYLSIGFTTSGSVAAGGTSIPVSGYASGVAPCYAGDVISDLTTPAAINPGSTVISSTNTAVTVAGTVVIGSGIGSGDTIMCAMPGYSALPSPYANLPLSFDNTHPWDNSMLLLQPTSTSGAGYTFMKQLLGLQ